MFLVERYHDFSAGHRVYGHESKCGHLHGHNYRIHFSVTTKPGTGQWLDSVGRVVDFSIIKLTLCDWLESQWDHKMLIFVDDPWLPILEELDSEGIVAVPFNPTAENMAKYLVETIAPALFHSTNLVLLTCRIEETRKCSASYTYPSR